MTARICALPGCNRKLGSNPKERYCTSAHRWQAHRTDEVRAAWRAQHPHAEAQPRQDPPRRIFRLRWDVSVVIRPDMPAPVKCYADGQPMLFQDDLAAIADKGSPGTLSRPVIVSPSVSVLAGLG